jgi:hypothetical protein
MTTAILLGVVAVVIAAFSYFTNAGFGDRKPKELREKEKREKAQASAAPDDVPPPHK